MLDFMKYYWKTIDFKSLALKSRLTLLKECDKTHIRSSPACRTVKQWSSASRRSPSSTDPTRHAKHSHSCSHCWIVLQILHSFTPFLTAEEQFDQKLNMNRSRTAPEHLQACEGARAYMAGTDTLCLHNTKDQIGSRAAQQLTG